MRKGRETGGISVSFSPEDFKYRLDEFLSSGSDDKGQSVRLFFRCPPSLERTLEVVRDSRKFPYQTVTDIIRHAVIRHAEWLYRMEPDMPRHFLSGLNAINELVRDSEMLSNIQQTFTRLDNLIETFIAKGDLPEAQRLLSQVKGQMTKIPDSRWKRDFVAQFSLKFSRHLIPNPFQMEGAATETGRVLEFPTLLPAPVSHLDPGGELDGAELDPTLDRELYPELEPEPNAD